MSFQPPPTWALPVAVDETTGKASFNPIWLKWFVDLAGVLNKSGVSSTGTLAHNSLGELQGGLVTERYHLNFAEYTRVTGTIIGTVTDVSVASANGFAGTVATSTTTPVITLTTTVTGIPVGNGTSFAASSVTNDVQTKAAIVPNTAPGAGQILVGNLGGTAYAPVTASGAVTLASTGAFSLATPGTLTVGTTNTGGTGAHVHTITSSNNPGAAASLLATDASGHIGVTANRIVKGWFTDLTVTNAIAGSVTGSAATLTTPRAINGTNFDGSAAITVTAAAGTLTGATLNSTVTASSLTSLGTLTSLTVSSGGASAAAAFTASGSGSSGTITVTDTGGNGVNLKLTGDGATTPNKTIRVHSGILQIVNSGYSAVISSLSDGGDLTTLGAITAYSNTAIPAGGTASTGLKVSSAANFGLFFGSGAPTLSAAQGSIYMRSDGSSTSTRLYVNTNGTTGWTNVVTAT